MPHKLNVYRFFFRVLPHNLYAISAASICGKVATYLPYGTHWYTRWSVKYQRLARKLAARNRQDIDVIVQEYYWMCIGVYWHLYIRLLHSLRNVRRPAAVKTSIHIPMFIFRLYSLHIYWILARPLRTKCPFNSGGWFMSLHINCTLFAFSMFSDQAKGRSYPVMGWEAGRSRLPVSHVRLRCGE